MIIETTGKLQVLNALLTLERLLILHESSNAEFTIEDGKITEIIIP